MMISRTVRNVMTREVVTVNEQAPFTELVRLMAVHKLSALPVVDGDGQVVGIVSEADLLRKEEYQDEQDAPHWLERRHQRVARYRIKRLPVVDDQDRLVGIVSRADLLRLFLRDDEAIHREILDEVLLRALWIDPAAVLVT